MAQERSKTVKILQDSGLGSLGSESDTSPTATSYKTESSQNVIHNVIVTDSSIALSDIMHDSSDCGLKSDVDGPSLSTDVKKPTNVTHKSLDSKSFLVNYLGNSQLDRRYTQPMLPWIISEVRNRQFHSMITLEVLNHTLRGTVCDRDEMLFDHKLQNLSRFARMHHDPKCFAYLFRPNIDSPFCCHVFEAPDEETVPELFTAIREATKEVVKENNQSASDSKEGKSVDNMGELRRCSHGSVFFEVLYVGKVTVSEKKAPPTFIDEAVEKFRQHELQQQQKFEEEELKRKRHPSGTSIRSLPSSLDRAIAAKENELQGQVSDMEMTNTSTGSASNDTLNSDVTTSSSDSLNEAFTDVKSASCPSETLKDAINASQSGSNGSIVDRNSNGAVGKDLDNLLRSVLLNPLPPAPLTPSAIPPKKNRTMLLQIGQSEVCLISPDRKTVMLERRFKDISFCSQGIKQPEHFGFISRDPNGNAFHSYVFKCAGEDVVDEIMQTLKQAFTAAFQQNAKNHVVCELCPMHQLHKLCQEIEGQEPAKVYEIITRRVEQLQEKDFKEIMTKFQEEELTTYQEMNETLMMILRQVCEQKQKEHTHISDSSKGSIKNEFNLMDPDKGKPSVFDSFKSKAKKSLASSFENLLRGRNKREESREIYRERSQTLDSDISHGRSFDSSSATTPDLSPCVSPTRSEFVSELPDRLKTGRPRSSTIGAIPNSDTKAVQEFAKVQSNQADAGNNNTPKPESPSYKRNMFIRANTSVRSRSPSPPALDPLSPTSPPPRTPRRQNSWRRNIFNRVVTPGRRTLSTDSTYEEEIDSEKYAPSKRRLSPQSIRALWRKAILETLLLIRMEKENKSLQARQDAMETKRLKLDYEEITPCLKEVTKVWEEMLKTSNRAMQYFKSQKILSALKAGVPRSRRGDIWQLMVEQHRLQHPDLQRLTDDCHAPYEDLLKQLTTHQHAILIDLGRTFPSHPYFSTQLGAGQLSLFNLLKAYSLLDKEVGYCQGLSFVAGVLLMHMQEERAFETLEYMMFQLGFRKQYRPDMICLQIQMYQLSRLLHDHYRDLYEHFEDHEIAPTLYAAPWFLTLFASQFPLGFVGRVFDLIFWQGMEVIFKVALVLLGNHKELIMQCDSFESVVEFLKTTLPEMGIIQMERIINQVFELDITKQLQAYEVEYHVLQEEMVTAPSRGDADTISKLELSNQNLRQQNRDLIDQLQAAHSQNHSLEVQLNQEHATQQKLKSHICALELERAALLNTVTKLRSLVPEDVLNAADINIPAISEDVTVTNSPTHSPSVNRMIKLEASSSHKQQNLSAEADRLRVTKSGSRSRSSSPRVHRKLEKKT